MNSSSNSLHGPATGVRSGVRLFMESLATVVRQNDVETMLQNARLTRDWPDREEKSKEASRQVRMAMYERALGGIPEDVAREILDILRPCCPDLFASPSPPPNEWQSPGEK